MTASLQLNNMSFAEKIQTMELLWDDLCKAPEQLESPAWHLDELNHREQMVKEGKAEYIDLDAVKKEISKAIE
ncbi:hypothetical protein MNBD_GAMMA01-508 [hydrothermal vent metagenome]|uniref:Addiction module component n=1 Tax=hydrothermal vent metagenome TaxID=652676 RepID=A0A3B0V4Z1_9ZZZZ